MPSMPARSFPAHTALSRRTRRSQGIRRKLAGFLVLMAACAVVVPADLVDAAIVTSRDLRANWNRTHTISMVQEGSTRIRYRGTWRSASHSGYTNDRVRWSKQRGASATFAFSGTGVAWIGPKGPTRGKARVYIDGVYVKTVSMYATRFAADRVLFTRTFASPSAHTLKIVVLGTVGHPMVAIDAFVVRGAPRPAPLTTSTTTNSPTTSSTSGCSTLQGRIDAASSGSVLDLTGCTYSSGATINKRLTLRGATINAQAGRAGLTITADNVVIDRVTVIGAQARSFSWGEKCITVNGSASNAVANLTITNSVIRRCGYSGLYVRFASDALIDGNLVEDLVYAGIVLSSVSGSTISDNVVRRVGVYGSGANGNNAYGITATHEGTAPRSSDVRIIRNTVETVPTWHGLDTHGGVRIRFEGNTVRAARRAAFLTAGPIDVVMTGNTLIAPTAAQQAACPSDAPDTYCTDIRGITLVGADGATVTNNTGSGWGSDWYTNSGSTGVILSGNTVH
jgi:hypothetical protein